jgi:hypothetical protein
MLPATLEWHLAAGLCALVALVWWPAWGAVATLLALSLAVAALQASQAALAPEHEGLRSRLLIAAFCYAQPLVRSWRRYRTRLFSYCPPIPTPVTVDGSGVQLSLTGTRTIDYWSEEGHERTELLGLFIAYLVEHRWGTTVDSGWSQWDVEVHYHPWTLVQVCTAQEDHGGGKRQIRVRYQQRFTELAKLVGIVGLAATAVAGAFQIALAAAGAGLLTALLLVAWCRGARLAVQAIDGFDKLARDLNLFRCQPGTIQGSGVRSQESGVKDRESAVSNQWPRDLPLTPDPLTPDS